MKARATWRAIVAATIVATSATCAFAPSTGPTPLPPPAGVSTPQAPAPTTVATARAALELTSVELTSTSTVSPRTGLLYGYRPTITLRETRGQSPVTVDSIVFVGSSVGVFAFPAAGCMGDGWYIRPGAAGTLTLHPACAFSTGDEYVGLAAGDVRVTVIYKDDRGEVGQVTGYNTVANRTQATSDDRGHAMTPR